MLDKIKYFSSFTSDIIYVGNELIKNYSQVRVLFHILQLIIICYTYQDWI